MLLTNSGKAVENGVRKAKNWETMTKTFFLNKAKGKLIEAGAAT